MWPPSSEEILLARIDHRHRVPADDPSAVDVWTSQSPGQRRLAVGGDRVDVRRVERRDRPAAGVLRPFDHARQQRPRSVRAVVRDDGVDRLEPLARLDRVDVGARRRSEAVWIRCPSFAADGIVIRRCPQIQYTRALYPRAGVPLQRPHRDLRTAAAQWVGPFRIPSGDGRQGGRGSPRARRGSVRWPASLDTYVVESELLASQSARRPRPPAALRVPLARRRGAGRDRRRVGLLPAGLHRAARHAARRAARSSRRSSSGSTRCSRPATARTRSSCSSTRGRRSAARSSSTRARPAAISTTCVTRSSRSSTRATRPRGDRERRGISGKSSGGYGAMVVPMLRPDVFGAFASHSGDALFECCYLPALPRGRPSAARPLRGLLRRFLRASAGRRSFRLSTIRDPAGASTPTPPPTRRIRVRPGRWRSRSSCAPGRLVDEVWERWLALDPVRMVSAPRGRAADDAPRPPRSWPRRRGVPRSRRSGGRARARTDRSSAHARAVRRPSRRHRLPLSRGDPGTRAAAMQ